MLGRHQGKKRTTPQDARGRRQRAAKDAHDNDSDAPTTCIRGDHRCRRRCKCSTHG
ncbi:hypothetical protein PTSG_07329 [Salpingoeca rosetta]|uniref:Uncharacterized protein n=1 Tax=Salpingoeca rosetta (strain ATCC 50818 / BSB-021) TaxID=946362 RepID=F2UJ38_SALR5|nr:uncharacterized protein PTSG_07329 [Salpingoeca rosetta]EGD76986.1 hypothetical protein PTSG_07329 [Salpingoeca rosetta]|eukprot:XP_004990826.1 hypothetical protein PTSG_07329 [Salpingoeca rosetta]